MAKLTKAKKAALSFTGFSTPIFGLSWNPPKDQREMVPPSSLRFLKIDEH